MSEISSRLNLEEYSFNQLTVEEVHHAPFDPYAQSDRHYAPSGYMVAGSLGCRIIRPDGKEASLYLVDFHHTRDFHHNLWLWGWDFNGEPISDKSVPHHYDIALDKHVYVKVQFGSEYFKDTFKPSK